MLKNLITRYSKVKMDNSLTKLKTIKSLKNFKLSRTMMHSKKNHRAVKKFTLRHLKKVGLLPARKNLNVYSQPNIEALIKNFQQTKQQVATREIFYGFKRIKIGKIKPTFEELPYLLFSYYTHFLVKKKTTELKTELFL
jgi:hypothetical protein